MIQAAQPTVGDRSGHQARRLAARAFTKQPMKVTWPNETAGMVVTYVGRWVSAKGEEGPWSVPLPVQVAFAGAGLMNAAGQLGGIDRAGQAAMLHEYRRAA